MKNKKISGFADKLFLTMLAALSLASCKKDYNPFDDPFPDPKIIPATGTSTGSLANTIPLPFSDAFNYGATVDLYGIPAANWIEAFVGGSKTDRGWAYRTGKGPNGNGDDAMLATAFGGESGTDNVYLITGPFNFNAYPVVNIGFDISSAFGTDPGTLTVEHSVNFSGSGDPSAAAWTVNSDITAKLPATDNVWKAVVSDLSAVTGTAVYIGFHFQGGTNVKSKQWVLDNFKLVDSLLAPADTGSGGGDTLTGLIATPFSDNFNYGSTVATYAIPTPNWIEGIVPGSKTDRGWAYRPDKGVNGTGDDAMLASAFGGDPGTDNTYLITGPFDFNGSATDSLIFDVQSKFGTGPGPLLVKYSTTYTGSGNPEAGGVTWTEITDITSQLPATDDVWKKVRANISTITGTVVFISFHYKGGTNVSAKQWTIDNFSIK